MTPASRACIALSSQKSKAHSPAALISSLSRHGSSWRVLVSGKADQARDLARLDQRATVEG